MHGPSPSHPANPRRASVPLAQQRRPRALSGQARRLPCALLAVVACAGVVSAAEPVVSPDAKLEKIFDGGLVLTEGVAVAPDGMVYFSDITFTHVSRAEKKPLEAGHIWKFDPTTGRATIFRSPSGMSNGLKFDAEGNLLAAEG